MYNNCQFTFYNKDTRMSCTQSLHALLYINIVNAYLLCRKLPGDPASTILRHTQHNQQYFYTPCCRLMSFLLLQKTLASATALPYTHPAQILQRQASPQLRLLAMHRGADTLYQHTCMREALRLSLKTTTWWKVCHSLRPL